MKLSLRTVTTKAVEAYPKEARKVWVLNWPGQVVLAASIVHWTTEVTRVSYLHKPTNYLRLSCISNNKQDIRLNSTNLMKHNKTDFKLISKVRQGYEKGNFYFELAINYLLHFIEVWCDDNNSSLQLPNFLHLKILKKIDYTFLHLYSHNIFTALKVDIEP